MHGSCGEPSTRSDYHAHDDSQGAPMSPELLALLRQRVANRYYDQPHVIERIARAMLTHE
jgi:hypothetical protein